METVDVLVAGGGPAGATAAALLARNGVRVVLLERERAARLRDGERVPPAARPVLARLGVLEETARRYAATPGVRALCGRTGRTRSIPYPDPTAPGFHVSRADFDELLRARATTLGADTRLGWKVRDAAFDGGTALVEVRREDGAPWRFRARVLLDATGGDALLATRVCQRTALTGVPTVATYAHVAGAERQRGADEHTADVVTLPHGWFWSIPLRGGLNAVGAASTERWARTRHHGETPEAFFDRTTRDAPWAARILSQAQQLGALRTVPGFAYTVDPLAGEGWLLAGEAAGFIDPLFAPPALLALCTGALAADAVLAALGGTDRAAIAWAEYSARVRAAHALAHAAARAVHSGPLADALFDAPPRRGFSAALAALFAGELFTPPPTFATQLGLAG